MKYRKLGRTGISVSEVGLGCEFLQGKEYDVVKAALDEAFNQSINIFDVFMSEPQVRTNIGKALAGRRDKAVIQGHIGSIWKDGQYTRSRNLEDVKPAFDDLLNRLNTDYIDIGMVHFVDEKNDCDIVFQDEFFDYVRGLKEKGIIKTIGLSSHVPSVAIKAVETGLVDVLMFSLNPAFDIMPAGAALEEMFEKPKEVMKAQLDKGRMNLYHACERHGTAITVMKTYMAGRLLDASKSPFEVPMTTTQCIHFALTRPAVASALIGCITPDDIRQAVSYENAGEAERDFSEVFVKQSFKAEGHCVYCNHCLPCPAYIDIALVNKYLDLADASDVVPETVYGHYNDMKAKAGDCTACGTCEARCPFGVPVIERMNKAVKVFKS